MPRTMRVICGEEMKITAMMMLIADGPSFMMTMM